MIDVKSDRLDRRSILQLGLASACSGALVLSPFARQAFAQTGSVQWGSSSLGSTGYVIIEALASTVNKHTDLKSSSMATSGGAENMALLGESMVQFGQTTSSDWPAAFEGNAPYNGPVEAHQMFAYTLWNMPPIVHARSDIKSFEDLKGRRVMPSQPTSSTGAMWKVLFQAAGLESEVDWNYGSWRETYDAFKAGKVDVIPANITNGRPSPILSELLVSEEVRALELSEELLDKASEINPGILTGPVDSAVWNGEGGTIRAPSFSGIVGAAASVDEQIGYAVTKAVFENEEEIRAIGVQLQDIRLQFAVKYLLSAYPVNPGAAKYFKERGVWRDDLTIAG